MEETQYFVYILAKARNSTFYVGVTNDLLRRVYEHKEGIIAGFTKKYGIKMLVYYEVHRDIKEAIRREKAIKRWTRSFKMNAIERMNPNWKDLYYELVGAEMPGACHPGRSNAERREPDPGIPVVPETGMTMKETI